MRLWHLAVGFFLVLSVIFMSFRTAKRDPESIQMGSTLETSFAYDKDLFLKGVSSVTNNLDGNSQVVILPHHLLASPLIAQGVKNLNLSTQTPTIIILSPNHANTGGCDIATSTHSWSTPFGQVNINKDLQQKLLLSKGICIDNDVFPEEHGVATLLPYIKYFSPQAQIIPIVFKKNIELKKLNTLSLAISELLKDKNTLVLSSLDFSHNLSYEKSKQKDLETEKYIQTKNYDKINTLQSDNLDSPAVLIVSLMISQNSNLQEHQFSHQASTDYNKQASSVTSYFVYGFTSPGDSGDLSLLFGGDVMLGRTVNTQIIKKNSFSWPAEKISQFTSQSDFFMVNLESPFNKVCLPTDSGMVFCADQKNLATLTSLGVDAVSIANNHIYNQGKDGFNFTLNLLKQNNIYPVGETDQISTITVKNHKIGLLAFNDIPPYPAEINKLTSENLKTQIAKHRSKVDLLIVNFHWGNEYSQASSRQKEYSRLAIDSGADAVIGHHPHWVQGSEEYKGKPIYYSLGNLIFDQMWSEETKKGLLVKLTFNNKKLIKQEMFPVKISDYGLPAVEGLPAVVGQPSLTK